MPEPAASDKTPRRRSAAHRIGPRQPASLKPRQCSIWIAPTPRP